ncbi:hypothetical protein ACIP5Y_28860 [Nocardia sp. NPDC088792]|uniref:hypothetical protein n=1 Tax=Nocardia sp. NPDC088792 TaxID=3364332 RepID=UPI00380DF69A
MTTSRGDASIGRILATVHIAEDFEFGMRYEYGATATGKLTYAKVLSTHDGGVMPGFDAKQACSAHESMMDKLAYVLDMDPIRVRQLNAVMEEIQFTAGTSTRVPSSPEDIIRNR